MPSQTWTLTDTAAGKYVDQIEIGPPQLPEGVSITKRRLRDGLSDGVDVVEIDNGRWRFSVLPTRGMALWRGKTSDGLEVGWKSPVGGPVHPAYVPIWDPSGLGWLDGFDELLCRCGLESNGAPDFDDKGLVKYPLHGKIGNLPAHKVEVAYDAADREISVTGVIDESRFHFQKLRLTSTIRVKPGELGLRIEDEVTNLSGTPATAQLLYHINFGQPLLDPGSRVVVPVKEMSPRNAQAAEGIANWESYANERPGFAEQVYFMRLHAAASGETQVLLKNAHATQGVSLHFSTKDFPCFTLWKNTAAAADGYVTGLEPGTNFPNPRTFEEKQGRVISLRPGETASYALRLELHPDAASIQQAEKAIAKLRSAAPTIHAQPQRGWTVL